MEKVEWDDSLQGDLLSQWKLILTELGTLSNISVDRWILFHMPPLLPSNYMAFVMHLLKLTPQWCIYECLL